MRATTFIKNANKKLMKSIDKRIKQENKALTMAILNSNKPQKFKGILSQLKTNK